MDKLQRHWQITLLSGMTALLFFPIPIDNFRDYQSQIWNLGHSLYFFLLISWLFKLYGKRFNSLLTRTLFFLLITALFSGAIEMIQSMVGRMASLEDAYNNLLGCLLALFLYQYREIDRKIVRYSAASILLLFIIWRLSPLSITLADSAFAYRLHPVIANFETPFETIRWRSNFPFEISDEATSRQLVVHLQPRGNYPGITLTPRVQDWRGYSALRFEIYNSSQQRWSLHLRINDRQHREQGNHHNDRYNRTLQLHPGWNQFQISLDRVKAAPAERDMDMANITKLILFFTDEPSLSTIQLDNIVLSND